MKNLFITIPLLLFCTCCYSQDLMELPATKRGETIIRHKGYVVSYNVKKKIPNWVAYELTAQELEGNADREGRTFGMDPQLKQSQGKREDYSKSGWTKGHMAPAADFRWDGKAMDETFYLTNVCPQNESLNAKDWNYLEKRVRGWARDYGKVWVVTGPIIGRNKYGEIGQNDITVPDKFFKAILVKSGGKYYSIAFIMNNDSSRQYLKNCSLSVNRLERITGYDFYPMLDDAFEESVENQMNLSWWHISH